MTSNAGTLQQVAQVCTYWQGWTALAIVVSGFLGATVATVAISMSRKTAREKNAADFLQMAQRDKVLMDGLRAIRETHRDGTLESFALKENRSAENAASIRYVLNFYECVAIGINHKIYSETFIKNVHYSTIVDLCDRTRPFVEHVRVRKKQPTAWEWLETLGKQWKEKPI